MRRWIAFSALTVAVACSYGPGPAEGLGVPAQGDTLVTLTNLHIDARVQRLYSAHYVLGEVIPMCTPVVIGEWDYSEITFTVVKTQVKYTYYYHRSSTPEGLAANALNYFGLQCESAAVQQMSAVDKAGIKSGTIAVGMTKQAVIYAVGYPPVTRTPTIEADQWVYWRSKSKLLIVTFEDGSVTGTREQ
jgi:hypothetical protein